MHVSSNFLQAALYLWKFKALFMKRNLFTYLIVILVFPLPLLAQDTILQNLPLQWTLEECINYAKNNNIQVNLLRLSERSSNEDLLQSKAARLPSVSGSVSQTLANAKNADPVVGGFQSQSNFSSGYGVNSSLVLYNGGYLKNDIKSKELAMQSANLNIKEAENNITMSITEAFLNILLVKENIVYLQDLLNTSAAQLKQGKQRFDAGSISRKDYVQLESQVATDQYNLVTAQNNYRLNVVTLKQVLQLPSSYNMQVVIPDSIFVEQAVPGLTGAQDAATQSRPEIRNSQIGIQIAQTELEKAKAQVKPTISLGAGISSGYSDNQTSKYLSQINNNFYQSLGVTMGIPIFSRRVNKTNINKSKIQVEQAKLSLLNTRTVLNQQVEQSYINLQNAQAQYQAAQTQLKASEESYKITNAELQLGAINLVDLLQQKNLYVQSVQSFIQAKYTAVLNYKLYEFYTGSPITL